jgi:hypothetical protein
MWFLTFHALHQRRTAFKFYARITKDGDPQIAPYSPRFASIRYGSRSVDAALFQSIVPFLRLGIRHGGSLSCRVAI